MWKRYLVYVAFGLFATLSYFAGGKRHDKFMGGSAGHADDIPQDVRLVRRTPHHQAEQFWQSAALLPAAEHPCRHGG